MTKRFSVGLIVTLLGLSAPVLIAEANEGFKCSNVAMLVESAKYEAKSSDLICEYARTECRRNPIMCNTLNEMCSAKLKQVNTTSELVQKVTQVCVD